MALLSLFMRRQLPQAVCHYARLVRQIRPPAAGAALRRLHGSARQRVGEKGPWGKSRGPEQQQLQQQHQLTDLDKADALVSSVLMLQETGSFAFSLVEVAVFRKHIECNSKLTRKWVLLTDFLPSFFRCWESPMKQVTLLHRGHINAAYSVTQTLAGILQ